MGGCCQTIYRKNWVRRRRGITTVFVLHPDGQDQGAATGSNSARISAKEVHTVSAPAAANVDAG